jgi:two-component system, NarL family, sensor histidine kinase UhpB
LRYPSIESPGNDTVPEASELPLRSSVGGWRWKRLSLRSRLLVLVSAAFILVGLLAGALAVHNARQAVMEELESSIRLTRELIEVALASAPDGDEGLLLDRLRASFSAIDGTRHITLSLEGGSSVRVVTPPPAAPEAPAWFTRLLEVESVDLRLALPLSSAAESTLVIRAEPEDEIAEAWADVRALMVFLVLALLLADVLVVLTVTHALRPVQDIRRALDAVERGDLSARLPSLELPELDGIARQFNHMVEVLEAAREDNRRLASRSLSIQERERRHLAQELHDEMGQSLSAIRAIAASLMHRAGDRDPTSREAAAEIARIASHVYDAARGMMLRLRPVTLDELGLKAAIETLVDDWNGRFEDCFCRLDTGRLPAHLPDDIAIGAYRIIQEALTNVVKHSRATEVAVLVRAVPAAETLGSEGHDQVLELRVTDNGRGLASAHHATEGGLGLRGIRERAEAAGGRFTLIQPSAGGLRVEVDLPFEEIPA